MFKAVLQNHKELLQRWIFRVQRAAETEGGLDQNLNAELHHAEEI